MEKVISFEERKEEEKHDCRDLNPAFVQITKYNSAGEVLSEVTTAAKRQNGSGFVLSYTEEMCDFLVKYSSGSVVRVFLYIAHHQQYGTNSVYGFRCSHKYLRQILNLDKKTIYNAMSVLKENFLIHELRVDGVSEFMVNPNYITMGREKKDRMREWNQRWANTFRAQSAKV